MPTHYPTKKKNATLPIHNIPSPSWVLPILRCIHSRTMISFQSCSTLVGTKQKWILNQDHAISTVMRIDKCWWVQFVIVALKTVNKIPQNCQLSGCAIWSSMTTLMIECLQWCILSAWGPLLYMCHMVTIKIWSLTHNWYAKWCSIIAFFIWKKLCLIAASFQ